MKSFLSHFLLLVALLASSHADPFSLEDQYNAEVLIYQPVDCIDSHLETPEVELATNLNLTYFRKSNRNAEDDFEDYPMVQSKTEEFYGMWATTKPLQQFSLFRENLGYAQLFISHKTVDEPFQTEILLSAYEGQYKNGQVLTIGFIYNNYTDWNTDENAFMNENSMIKATLFFNDEVIQEKYCNANIKLSFSDSADKYSHHSKNTATTLQLESVECDIALTMEATSDNFLDGPKVIAYTIIAAVIFLGHLYTCLRIFKKVSLNPSEGSNYSLVSLSFFTAWDIFFCIFNFYSALQIKAFSPYFFTIALLYFVLSSTVETKLLLLIWKVKYSHICQSPLELKQRIQQFYTTFYFFLGAFLTICSLFISRSWLFYATSFFLAPQIAQNAMRRQKYKFDGFYILLLGVLRIIVPVYIKGSSHSLFRLTPSTSFSICYPIIILSQVLILYLQSKLGSRFFVPSFLLTGQYNYFTKIPSSPADEIEVCSICMEKLNQDPQRFCRSPSSGAQYRFTTRVMKTPCNHYYHEKCLRDWMEIKLECPFCRTTIPGLE